MPLPSWAQEKEHRIGSKAETGQEVFCRSQISARIKRMSNSVVGAAGIGDWCAALKKRVVGIEPMAQFCLSFLPPLALMWCARTKQCVERGNDEWPKMRDCLPRMYPTNPSIIWTPRSWTQKSKKKIRHTSSRNKKTRPPLFSFPFLAAGKQGWQRAMLCISWVEVLKGISMKIYGKLERIGTVEIKTKYRKSKSRESETRA